MRIKNTFVLFVILFLFWILINNAFQGTQLLIGAGISLVLALLFCRNCNVFNDLKLSPKAIFNSFIYLFIFSFELVKSNLDVARRVITPSLPIQPAIVRAKTKLKSPMGRLILANSITLTPGTLTVDIEGDTLYIHWIDAKTADMGSATDKIVRKFEKYLEVIYG